MWFNFAHLFSVSLLPLYTAWMAVSELAPQPVSFYAAVFFLVNATYIFLIREVVDRRPARDVAPRVRRIMRVRSVATLCLVSARSTPAANALVRVVNARLFICETPAEANCDGAAGPTPSAPTEIRWGYEVRAYFRALPQTDHPVSGAILPDRGSTAT